ncbi:hypothetical protein REG_0304 [Candidatus Regiella insecticola LSR1]|uniref:Uncharacterized protein n=1 Tax=Candidatus Regiella insecticola LSR1 TaxID=663321 RepID=E0WQV5_9ENTR|nr:hypothetical protein REG_0304 [Candidatus Regiella insecticola LSR1]
MAHLSIKKICPVCQAATKIKYHRKDYPRKRRESSAFTQNIISLFDGSGHE